MATGSVNAGLAICTAAPGIAPKSSDPSAKPKLPVGVFGQDFTSGEPDVDGPPKAIQFAPVLTEKKFYSTTAANVSAAIEHRIDQKQIQPSLTDADEKRIKRAMRNLTKKLFSKTAVLAALDELGILSNFKSKKWSPERYINELEMLCQKEDPGFKFKGIVKNEPSADGKAPRLIIDEGGMAQIMAVCSVKVIEKIIFSAKNFEKMSIKGRAKKEAMAAIVEHLNIQPGQEVVEGDGSAWDTCCNAKIRDLTENVVLKEVTRIIIDAGFFLGNEQWLLAHLDANTARTFKLFTGKKGRIEVFILDAIRRSGHRGTSVLNWLINFVLTYLAIFADPFSSRKDKEVPGGFLDMATKGMKDLWGVYRMIRAAFEGDDSIYSLFPRLSPSQMVEVQEFWKRCGFRMKLFSRLFPEDRVAEFTGWVMAVREDGTIDPTNVGPDILRNLENCGYTTSATAAAEWGSGKDVVLRSVAAASCASYSMELTNCRTVSRMFKRWAEHFGFEDGKTSMVHATKNQKMILGLEDDACPVIDVTEDDGNECAKLRHLGIIRDEEHYKRFVDVCSVLTPEHSDDVLRSIEFGPYVRRA